MCFVKILTNFLSCMEEEITQKNFYKTQVK